jgi:regulator of sigma E protease
VTEIVQFTYNWVLPFIIVISVIVFVHEMGHYWVARWCGVRIETFSIGFGPEIFGWNDRHGTRWKISCLPLGGYVKMFGDADPAGTPDEEIIRHMTAEEKKVAFFHKSVGQRAAIIAAGPASNYLFAILIMAVFFMTMGQPYAPPDISEVTAGGVAATAGLRPGDRVVAIDGAAVDRFEDIKRIVSINEGTPLDFEILRDTRHMHVTLTPEIVIITDRFGDEEHTGRIGITSTKTEYRHLAPAPAVKQAFAEAWTMTTMGLKGIGQIIAGTRSSNELGGPLRIAEWSGKVAQDGYIELVNLIAMFSINLGFVNLFPIPMLDGGHLAFCLAEWSRGGRRLPEKIQEIGSRVGVVFLLSLMVFVTWNDLVHLKVVSYIRSFFS